MCGIFGYIGSGLEVSSFIDGLSRLEYRGYDSCGIALIKDKKLFLKKQQGRILDLKNLLKDKLPDKYPLGICHTRWATHGRPNRINAHPHCDCKNKIVIVHNGIIENYIKLKEELTKKGHKFLSQTDSETIAHLIESFYNCSLEEAVMLAINKLEGSFALAIVSVEDNKLIGVRKNSPLIVGLNKDSKFLASDIPALIPFTKDIIYLKDKELAVLEKDKFSIFDFNGNPVKFNIERINIKLEEAEKEGFEHFMLKEIFQQPKVIESLLSLYIKDNFINFKDLNLSSDFLSRLKNVYITACGTAYHAGYIGKYFLEKYCNLNVQIDISSEFRYRKINFLKDSLVIGISQSGETQDTLSAIRKARDSNIKVLSICNVLGSSLVKETDGLIFTNAGLEIGVASTKAYTAQIICLILFSLYLASIKNTIKDFEFKDIISELKNIPKYQSEILENHNKIKNIADKFSKFGCFLFLGRGINYPSALEGALKLKEISYIPAEGYPAGEMKHGPIALIDEYRAVICIAPLDELYEKMVSNIQEIKARKGKVLSIINYSDKEAKSLSDKIIYIPQLKNQDLSPLLVAVVLQLFAYYVAKNLKREIDKPRNLAKSVTVE